MNYLIINLIKNSFWEMLNIMRQKLYINIYLLILF